MAKNSFSPKLNANEAPVLQYMSYEWTEFARRDFNGIEEQLANRGLLDREWRWQNVEYDRHSVIAVMFTRYRLSRRGELMLTRWQRQQADARYRLNAEAV